jgi:hypothetical protein
MSARITIATTAADLAAVLGTTIPFAAEVGYGIPSLEAVQITAGEGLLVGVATNRYTIGYARKSAVAKQPARFLLGVSQARAVRNTLTTLMKERETGSFMVEIDITGDGPKRSIGFHFEPFAMVFDECGGAGSFPDLAKLIGEQVQPGATPEPGPVGLSPASIKPFLKVAKWAEHHPLRWSFGSEMKPARVELDDWFVGLIMPVRLSDKLPPVEPVMPTLDAPTGGAL